MKHKGESRRKVSIISNTNFSAEVNNEIEIIEALSYKLGLSKDELITYINGL